MAITTIPRLLAARPARPKRVRVRVHQPDPPATAAEPGTDEPWHPRYATQDDGHGNRIRNEKSWRRCTCPIGDEHDES